MATRPIYFTVVHVPMPDPFHLAPAMSDSIPTDCKTSLAICHFFPGHWLQNRSPQIATGTASDRITNQAPSPIYNGSCATSMRLLPQINPPIVTNLKTG